MHGIGTFVAAGTIAFVMFRMLPGGPVQTMARQEYLKCKRGGSGGCNFERISQRIAARVSIDPSQPIPEAYVDFLQDVVLYQDFGMSLKYHEPVFELLFSVMPWSLYISLFGLALGWTFNIFWGAALAYNEGSFFDKGGTVVSMIGNSIPYYVAGIIALAFLAFELGIFPTAGRYPDELYVTLPFIGTVINAPDVEPGFNVAFMVGATWHAALPIFTGFVLGINGLAMRGNSIRIMESDYIQVARLRGLSQTRIAQRYVSRNAILPMYTALMIGIAGVFSSSIIMEKIFTYPAIGWYTYNALLNRDYPLLMGAFLFYTAITIAGIIIAEFTYQFIDPRIGGNDREAY